MSTALWAGGAALIVLLAVWRLRRATRTVNRILTEELERTESEAGGDDRPAC